MNANTWDRYSGSVELTSDCGVTVEVPSYAPYSVSFHAGGDLSIRISMFSPERARELARILIEAADEADKHQKDRPSWLLGNTSEKQA